MNEKLRNEIIQRWQAKTSQRQIARELGVSRTTVQQVIARFERERSGQTPTSQLPRPPQRPSSLDEHDDFIGKLLERYPNMTGLARQNRQLLKSFQLYRWFGHDRRRQAHIDLRHFRTRYRT